MATTLKQIARECGLDISTVSRCLNDAYGGSKETRLKVLAVAARLNYRPNKLARGLATGRSHTFGLLVADIRNPFSAEVARGAEDAAYRAGYDLLLCNSDLHSSKQTHYVHSLVEKRVEGIVMQPVGTVSETFQAELLRSRVPMVFTDRPPRIRGFATVSVDNFAGGRMAGDYLVQLGHRVIAHLTAPPTQFSLAERARGFLKACETAPAKVTPLIMRSYYNSEGGYRMMRALLAEHPEVTAVFTCNDVIAFGAIRAIFEVGKNVPDDISVIGFDDLEFATITRPPLTTIYQPKYELGQAAIEILLNHARRDGTLSPEHRLLEVRLVERESCRRQ